MTHLQRNLQSACSGRPEDSKAAVRDLVHAAVYQDDPDLARCVWAEAAPWVASVSARAGEVFEQAEDSALAFTAFPRAHWAKLRTNVSVNIFFTIFTNVFSPIAPTRMRRIRQRGCAAFGV